MKAKHTPEPWEYREPNGKGNGFLIESIEGEWPKLPGAWIGGDARSPEQLANIQVMTAAPNLLRCLRRLVIAAANREHTQGCPIRLIEVQAELRSAVAEARIEINKARGNI